jgi:hypothetical protein
VIYVVGANQTARHLLEKVVFLIGAFGGDQESDGIGAMLGSDITETVCRVRERLVPGCRLKPSIGSEKRLPQSIRRMHEINAKATFDAQVAPVHGTFKSPGDLVYQVVA